MKLKNQKTTIIVMAALFVLLVILYFAVIRPLTAVIADDSPAVDTIEGEVLINNTITNFYMFEPIPRASMQSIQVDNEFGGYKIYRDAADTFQLDGFLGLNFDAELFSSLVVTTGTPTVMQRIAQDLDDAGLAEYGFDDPQASWTITDLDGNQVKVYVGDELLTEGGYYVMLDGRNAVYIMGTTLADTVLQPAYKLLTPLLTAGMSSNTYFFVENFRVWHGDELFVNVEKVPDEEMSNPNAIVEERLLYPMPETGGLYEINDSLYFEILYKFIALQGESVEAFLPTEEQLTEFGLAEPAYTITYAFNDPNTEDDSTYDFVIFVSEQQADGTYYAVSNLLGYSIVCKVSEENLGWLKYDKFAWIFPTPFFENIQDVDRITIKADNIDVDFRLSHSLESDGATAVLDVTEVNSGTTIPNKDVKNFREFYKTMLNITNQEYATLSDADRIALTSTDDNLIMTMMYESSKTDDYCEYKFYRYVEESTGKISGGKIFVTVNGIGEFYTTNDLVEKVMNDVPRVLNGLDIDAYRHN